MAHASALTTLIELAHKETDEAAKQLGAALRASEEAKQKLDLLLAYRDDYAKRYQSNLSSGISATHFNNFQVFMHKLDDAIFGQQKVVGIAERHAEHAFCLSSVTSRLRLISALTYSPTPLLPYSPTP